MEEAIRSQQKDTEDGEVEELFLDNVKASCLSGLSDAYKKLRTLSVVNSGLTSLDGLPRLEALQRLDLGDNKLAGGLDAFHRCPALRHLSLVGNRIANLDDLKPLSTLSSLQVLDLYNCPVTELKGYREQVFELLPSLSALDGFDRNGAEVEDSDDGEDEEQDGEEEEEEEEGESGEDGEDVGLDYLQQENLDSDSEGEDYDPDQDKGPSEEDDVIPSDEDGDEGAGPSAKKPRLDPYPDPTAEDSSENSD